MRAIVIGFPKAGTTTIHRACVRSGLRSAHWRTAKGFCGQLIYESFEAGRDPLEQLADFDIVAQADICRPRANYWPNLDFRVLDSVRQHHPECILILNRRNPAKLVNSIKRYGQLHRRLKAADIIGLPKGLGEDDAQLLSWIENHYAACASRFGGDPCYLDLDIESPGAPEQLGRALGVRIRWWGVANATRQKKPAETEDHQPA